MSNYSGAPITLHVDVLSADGVTWLIDRKSFRESVEACVSLAERDWSSNTWRVVDAGGNVHELHKPSARVIPLSELWGGLFA